MGQIDPISSLGPSPKELSMLLTEFARDFGEDTARAEDSVFMRKGCQDVLLPLLSLGSHFINTD